jgi:hypothetical protein
MKISRLAILASILLLTSCTYLAPISMLITPHKEAEALEEVKQVADEIVDYEAKQLDPMIQIK